MHDVSVWVPGGKGDRREVDYVRRVRTHAGELATSGLQVEP